MSFPLLSLPAELLREVVSSCEFEEIQCLRLACKTLEVFVSAFLHQTVDFTLLPQSVNRLLAICYCPKFANTVHTITFNPKRFLQSDSLEAFKRECLVSLAGRGFSCDQEIAAHVRQLPDKMWLYYFHSYVRWSRWQQTAYQGSFLQSFLSLMFAKLPRLDSIIIADDFVSAEMHSVQENTLLGADTAIYGTRPEDVMLVLAAAADAKVRLKHLYLESLSESFLTPAYTENPKIQAIFHPLKSLYIDFVVRRSDRLAEQTVRSIQGLMAQCHQLEHLHIGVDGEAPTNMNILDLRLPWDHLQSLQIECLQLSENDLVDFVITHQPTLSWFQANSCPLTVGTSESLTKRLKPYLPISQGRKGEVVEFASKPWPRYLTPTWLSRHDDEVL